MTPQQAESFRYNVLDLTKVWPHKEFPLRPIGKIVLDENPQNYFAEIEQSAFSPSHTVPGIEPSADPVLQSRLFSYPDTHRHRLGVNYQQLPVNAPVVPVANFQRDGPGTFVSQGARPSYQSTISPLAYRAKPYAGTHHKHEVWAGHARAYLSEITERECINLLSKNDHNVYPSQLTLSSLVTYTPRSSVKRTASTLLATSLVTWAVPNRQKSKHVSVCPFLCVLSSVSY